MKHPPTMPPPGWKHLVRSLAAVTALQAAQGQPLTVPLTRNGDCPTLARVPMEIKRPGIFSQRYPGTIQAELPPQPSVNCAEVPPDLRASLWASELHAGNIKAVQAFTFDERGRLWAAETFDYPNMLTEPFRGNDRIVILEDTDGNGAADKSTVFVSGLNIPQGIEWIPEGLLVAMPPYLVLFEDKDGDDRADSPSGRILYQGFTRGPTSGDTHGGIANLRFGLDNWIYGSSGYNGGTVLGKTFRQGFFRAKRDGTAFDLFGVTSANTWGTGFMEDGQFFGSCGNGCGHTQHLPIPGRPPVRISTYGEQIRAVTEDVIQAALPGGFTASTDHEIYAARLLPPRYWGRSAFVTEGTGHLVNQAFLQMQGSTWKAARDSAQPNLFASKDAWTAPIQVRTGPDGALWILDWHNYLFLHNGAAPTGPGNAYVHPLRTKTGCRIYRVLPADGRSEPMPNLRNATLEQMVNSFRNTNMFWRLTAQKLILRRGAAGEDRTRLEGLLADVLAKSRQVDAIDNDPFVVHALWTAHGLGLLAANPSRWDPLLKDLLRHPAAGVRLNVLKAMPLTAASAQAIRDQGRVNDPHPHVRLQALLALGEMPKTPGLAIFRDYRNLDAHAQAAFALADSGAGISESGTLPAIPGLHPVSAFPGGPYRPSPGWTLRFRLDGDGTWEALPDPGLPAGRLILHSTLGTRLAEAVYDGRAWSARLGPLDAGQVVYSYRTGNGSISRGLVAPALDR